MKYIILKIFLTLTICSRNILTKNVQNSKYNENTLNNNNSFDRHIEVGHLSHNRQHNRHHQLHYNSNTNNHHLQQQLHIKHPVRHHQSKHLHTNSNVQHNFKYLTSTQSPFDRWTKITTVKHPTTLITTPAPPLTTTTITTTTLKSSTLSSRAIFSNYNRTILTKKYNEHHVPYRNQQQHNIHQHHHQQHTYNKNYQHLPNQHHHHQHQLQQQQMQNHNRQKFDENEKIDENINDDENVDDLDEYYDDDDDDDGDDNEFTTTTTSKTTSTSTTESNLLKKFNGNVRAHLPSSQTNHHHHHNHHLNSNSNSYNNNNHHNNHRSGKLINHHRSISSNINNANITKSHWDKNYDGSDKVIQTKSLKSNKLKSLHANDNDNDDDDDYDDDGGDDDNVENENDGNQNKRAKKKNNDDDQRRFDDSIIQNDDENVRSTVNSGNYNSQSNIPSLTRHKFETLSTREDVENEKQLYVLQTRPSQYYRELVKSHIDRVKLEGECKWPKPRIIDIRHDASKLYRPHCTVLHRCSEDTACCRGLTEICVMKHQEAVYLYFDVTTLFGVSAGQRTIEQHKLLNHTECHCVERDNIMQQHSPFVKSEQMDSPLMSSRLSHSQQTDLLLTGSTASGLKCPGNFEKVLEDDIKWRCDCSSGNMNCNPFQTGEEHFSLDDRKCILLNKCKEPTCEYGRYNRDLGRCPRLEEKVDNILSYNNNNNRY